MGLKEIAWISVWILILCGLVQLARSTHNSVAPCSPCTHGFVSGRQLGGCGRWSSPCMKADCSSQLTQNLRRMTPFGNARGRCEPDDGGYVFPYDTAGGECVSSHLYHSGHLQHGGLGGGGDGTAFRPTRIAYLAASDCRSRVTAASACRSRGTAASVRRSGDTAASDCRSRVAECWGKVRFDNRRYASRVKPSSQKKLKDPKKNKKNPSAERIAGLGSVGKAATVRA
jgi:hypothetical protein